jgi:hypothetical protein
MWEQLLLEDSPVALLPFIAIRIKVVCERLVRGQRKKIYFLVETPEQAAFAWAYPVEIDDFIVDAEAITHIAVGKAVVINGSGQCFAMGYYLP